MELDELKSLWKKQGDAFRPRNAAEIAAMLNGTSRSIVSKLKRSVWLELTVTVVAGVGLLAFALTLEESSLKNISIAVLIVFLGYMIYYIKKLSILNRFSRSDEDVRTNLERLVGNLTTYLKYYKLSYTILYPVYFCLGVVLGGLSQGADHFLEILTEVRTLVILGVIALGFYFSSTWLVNWMLTKLYGNHLEKLKLLLNDIRDEEKAA